MIDAPASTGRSDGFGSEMRRARLGVEGVIPGGFGFERRVGLSAQCIAENLRYDRLDLSDAGIAGGRQNGVAVSVIRTPTEYTRLMMNYGRMHYDDAIYPASGGDTSYSVNAFGMCAQIDFWKPVREPGSRLAGNVIKVSQNCHPSCIPAA